MTSGVPSRLAAVWFADIVGYSRLASRDEGSALALVELLRSIVDETLAGHRGRLVKSTGDGALAEFSSAGAAVHAALTLERLFAERADAIAPGARLRIGVHVGEVVPGADGDLFGDGVNTAARLQQSADPGEVVVSEDVWRSLHQRAEICFTRLGDRRLKGLAAPVQVYRVESADSAGPGKGIARGWLRRAMPRGVATVAVAAALAAILILGLLARGGEDRDESPESLTAGTPGSPAARASLAVLPFSNLSRDPEDEYFADGMTEELISTLGGLPGLDVVGRTSSWALEGTDIDVRQVGDSLGASAVLTGSVRRSEDRLRVNAQLVDAGTGYQLWSKTYDRDPADVFAVQGEIARAVAAALDLRLPRGVDVFRVRKQPPDPEAYDLYLKGRHAWRRRTREGLELAIDYFRRAIARDPGFAAAHAGLGDAHIQLAGWRYRSGEDVLSRAREAIDRALELDPELAEAYASRGIFRARADRSMEPALADFRRAIDLNPSYPSAHHWYAMTLADLGRFEDALPVFERAIELDPLAPSVRGSYGNALRLAGRLDRAEEMGRKANELAPELFGPLTVLSRIYAAQGRAQDALRAAEEAVALAPGNPIASTYLSVVHAQHGDRRKALEIVSRLEADADPCPPCLAEAYAALGDRENALRWLEAESWHNLGGFFFPKVDPVYEHLHEDPRFRRFLRNAGLE